MWNTSPPRQVTAGDFVREFKLLCNPVSPVGAPGYYTSTIVGMAAYCDAFGKVKPTAAAISGLPERPPARGRVRAQRVDAGLQAAPAGAGLPEHPGRWASPRPGRWSTTSTCRTARSSASTRSPTGRTRSPSTRRPRASALEAQPRLAGGPDPLRKAYVDDIDVTEGLTSESVQQQIEAGTGDLEWDIVPPTQDIPQLLPARTSGWSIGPSGPYYVGIGTPGAEPVRRPDEEQAGAPGRRDCAVDKNAIVKILGGPAITTTANQVILPGNVGYCRTSTRSRPTTAAATRPAQGAAGQGRLSRTG